MLKFTKNVSRMYVLILFAFFTFIFQDTFSQSYLNPQNYSSLGSFSSTGNITINMSTNQMSGGASFTGVVSNNILIFAFDNFNLNSGHTITFSNVPNLGNKVAFLSKNNMSIAGTINANANLATSGPGGGSGASVRGNNGSGSGGGSGNTNGGAGGAFGGNGGNAGYGAAGGSSYGDLSSSLTGGSGGGAPYYITVASFTYGGGGGGGAILLGASGTLSLTSTAVISATGAAGNNDTGNNDGSGGGSGGGGGRIHCAYYTTGSFTNNATYIISGGSGGAGGSASYNGVSGNNGNTTIVQSSNSALPVELTSFTASIADNKVNLNWQTVTEVNNYGFEIERTAYINIAWEKVGFVQGHGNSNSPNDYSFIDKPNSRSTFKYRLKQIDTDGKYEYSPEVEVNLNAPSDFSVKQNFPNPFNPSTKIEFSIPSDNNVEIKVFNVLGMEVTTLLNEHRQAGMHSVEFNSSSTAGGLSSGIYFYKVVSGNYSEIKKMLLLR